jgi:uncharacterized protein YdaU (DUF1376 family)
MEIAVHYFRLHINDYAQATAHLSMVEDAAYTRLLRKYYADERPLPADIERLQRLVGARSREEKNAVKTVLEEFFFLDGEFFRNKRADEELAEYQSKSLKAKESANARWMRSHSDSTANAKHSQYDRNANQEPLTINQEPSTTTKRSSSGSRLSIETLPSEWEAFCRNDRPDLIPSKVFEMFRDYWIAVPGSKGSKANWFSTWKNWVRNQRQTVTDKQKKDDGWQARLHGQNTIDMELSNGQVLSTDTVPF